MALRDSLAAPRRVARARCGMGAVVDKVTGKDADVLATALADDSFSSAEIAKALTAEGMPIGVHTVARHRRRECSCAV